MKVTLNTKKDIAIKEAVTINSDDIKVNQVTDNYTSVIALISFPSASLDFTRELILWEGEDYTNIGQWTDNDVQNRIKQLL
jgi:hypothetical protein